MKAITAEELKEKLESGENITLVDVRENYEHDDYNIGGINIPLAEIMSSGDKLRELGETQIVLYCRSGNRSAMAQKLLAQQNIHNTINLDGGVLAWQDAGF